MAGDLNSNLFSDQIGRLRKDEEALVLKIEKVETRLSELEQTKATWKVYLSIGIGLFVIISTFITNTIVESVKDAIAMTKTAK